MAKKFPKFEQYGLSDQLRRASVSVPVNITEGRYRNSTREFVRFLNIALGSIGKIETLLDIALRLEYLTNEEFENVHNLVLTVGKMSYGLRASLMEKTNTGN